ncbi:hypothetical protein HOY80DRAFT_981778 [Tuber brumale]|nr:hypothetical protein HOY80DRAFT_981778 [Tuber brumale]
MIPPGTQTSPPPPSVPPSTYSILISWRPPQNLVSSLNFLRGARGCLFTALGTVQSNSGNTSARVACLPASIPPTLLISYLPLLYCTRTGIYPFICYLQDVIRRKWKMGMEYGMECGGKSHSAFSILLQLILFLFFSTVCGREGILC